MGSRYNTFLMLVLTSVNLGFEWKQVHIQVSAGDVYHMAQVRGVLYGQRWWWLIRPQTEMSCMATDGDGINGWRWWWFVSLDMVMSHMAGDDCGLWHGLIAFGRTSTFKYIGLVVLLDRIQSSLSIHHYMNKLWAWHPLLFLSYNLNRASKPYPSHNHPCSSAATPSPSITLHHHLPNRCINRFHMGSLGWLSYKVTWLALIWADGASSDKCWQRWIWYKLTELSCLYI